MEIFWSALRRSKPVSLDYEQATALSGDLYRARAGGKVRTTAVTLMSDGRWEPDRETPGEERAGFDPILERLAVATGLPDEADLEVIVGLVVVRPYLQEAAVGRLSHGSDIQGVLGPRRARDHGCEAED